MFLRSVLSSCEIRIINRITLNSNIMATASWVKREKKLPSVSVYNYGDLYICIYICVCVCIYMCVCIYIYIYTHTHTHIYMCVCADSYTHTHTHIYIFVYIVRVYIYIYIYVCVCVCVKETVAAITILYRNTKVKVRSPDGDTEYFDIVAGVLQGDTLARYLFIICLDYVLRTSIDKIQRKWIRADKEKKQKVPRKNNYRRRLRRWHSVTGQYT